MNAIHSRMPNEEYRVINALNISRLKEMKRSPLHYQFRLANPLTTPPLTLGIAAHCAVLEPERFMRQFAAWSRRSETTGNLCPRNGQHWEAFKAANEGKTIVTEDEAAAALQMGQTVRASADAMRYLEAGEPEVTMRWDAHGRACKGRVDWITHTGGEPVLVGLKTTRDCRPFIFGNQAAKLDYALQWAWYFNGYMAIRGVKPRVIEIVIESAPPHALAVYRVPDDVLLQGEEEYLRLLERLAECEARKHWPGPCEGEQEVTLPTWYYASDDDDISDMGLVA
jgi:exodeoxyribonuclease VIII